MCLPLRDARGEFAESGSGKRVREETEAPGSGTAGLPERTATLAAPIAWLSSFRLVHGFSAHHGAQHAGMQDFGWRNLGDVAVQYHEVRQHPRQQKSLVFLGELRVSGAGGVGSDGF